MFRLERSNRPWRPLGRRACSRHRTCSRFGPVDAIGLWAIAAAAPARTAVIEPDGRAVSYAELAREADRYGRGPAGAGPGRRGHGRGAAAQQRHRAGRCTSPRSRPACTSCRSTGTRSARRSPTSWATAARGRSWRTSASPATRRRPRTWPGSSTGAVRGSGAVPGFGPLARLGDDGPAGRPYPRTHGAPMLYTSGTSGRPKGVRRPLTGADPDDAAAMAAWFFGLFGLAPLDGNVHSVRLAAVPHRACSTSPRSRSSSATRWC